MNKTAYDFMNDTYKDLLWGLRLIHPEFTWKKTDEKKLENIRISVIDSGVDSSHEDLKGCVCDGYNFVDNSFDTNDYFGHGTRVAGIIAAKRNNELGVAGLASGVKIIPLKVIDNHGKADIKNVIKALEWSIENNVDIINISMGYDRNYKSFDNLKYYLEEEKLINTAINMSIPVVASVGNKGEKNMQFPAAYKNVISVASCGINRDPLKLYKAEKNNMCFEDTIYAPGEYIYTTNINNSYVYDCGSSMACAFVSGAIALIKSKNKEVQCEVYKDLILGNTTIISDSKVNFLNVDYSFEKFEKKYLI